MAELLVKELPLTVAVPPTALRRPPPKAAELLAERAAAHRCRPGVEESAAKGGGVAGEGAVAHRRRPASRVLDAAAIVGCRVAGEGAAAHRRRPASRVLDAAAGVAGGVAGEGAAAHRRRRATLVEEATAEEGGVAGEGAAATVALPALSRPPPATMAELLVKVQPLTVAVAPLRVEEAAAESGGVAGESAVADRQRPKVLKAAAVSTAGIASLDRQAGDLHGLARFDLKDAEEEKRLIPLHGRGARRRGR